MEFAGMQSYTGNPAVDAPCATINGDMIGVEGWGNYNLFDGNVSSEADHMFIVSGSYNVFRRDVWRDTSAADWGPHPTLDNVHFIHPYAFSSNPTIDNLIEGNQEYDSNYSNQHFYLASTASLRSEERRVGKEGRS